MMTEDFYCDEVLSGKTKVNKVLETENVLAYHHTRPFWPVHIVAIPKKHISSLITLEEDDNELLLELLGVIKGCGEGDKRKWFLQGAYKLRRLSGFKASALAYSFRRSIEIKESF